MNIYAEKEIEGIQNLCSELYQILGQFMDEIPVEVLDKVAAAANGEDISGHPDLLPWYRGQEPVKRCKEATCKSEFLRRFIAASDENTLRSFGVLGCYKSYRDFCCPEHAAEEFSKEERENYQ